jgi:replication factor C subunit 3/5
MVLELNASDERGIDVVRDQIKTFAATKTFSGGNDLKLIILDEADAMTSAAQNALRRVMEKYVRNVRFIIICNYVGQIIPPLQSRCTRFRFAPLPLDCLKERMDYVIVEESINVSEEAKEALIRIANGDMRRVLNVLQAAAAAFHPNVIDEDAIYAVTAAPHPVDLQRILEWLTNDHFELSQAFNST